MWGALVGFLSKIVLYLGSFFVIRKSGRDAERADQATKLNEQGRQARAREEDVALTPTDDLDERLRDSLK